jgi:RNA recognition motif-containing protein
MPLLCLPSLLLAGKPRGYAFIEYEHKADMKEAYKAANGRKLEGRRILVDVERGRTVDNWWVLGQGMVKGQLQGGLGKGGQVGMEVCLMLCVKVSLLLRPAFLCAGLIPLSVCLTHALLLPCRQSTFATPGAPCG